MCSKLNNFRAMEASKYFILLTMCAPILGLPPSNNSSEINCENSGDCSSGKVCVNFKCGDPCHGGCGPNTICLTVDKVSMCACKPGFTGYPFNGCYPEECRMDSDCPEERECRNKRCEDVCKNACGLNTHCKGINHYPVCSCSPEHVWNPFLGCQVQKAKDCTEDSDCLSNRTCINYECVDPCDSVCGNNTICTVENHHTACACRPGFIGNPFQNCVDQEIKECTEHSDCLSNRTCSNFKCVDPCDSVCGNNTICTVENHTIACACKPGFVGNPFQNCVSQGTIELQKKYYIGKEQVTWTTANERCRSKDMYFASITSPSEQDDIKRACKESGIAGLVWVSGSDLGSTGEYVWSSTGKGLTYTNWKSGEPEEEYRCVAFHTFDYKWETRACGIERYYACEYFRS
ncbi:adhesion G protein-coupled receptor E1-like isoform X2 [Homalodisca vitripennis]|uniref:adhesion G protein-coupled receptor E1-like isoform X2 n=1 Tax=Homalodisca vitripennis TaxID=197043 RepID=UPI001EECABAD|nr:adhesion G protein-coupled receptor E1-like isoform X2 [Homalodisca vitripennis]